MSSVAGLGAILTAIVTPFDDDLNVDEEAFVDLLHHLSAHGSDGFVVCGTTGEASTLTDEEHLRVVELAVQNRPEGDDDRRRHRLQRHAPRRPPDRARHRARRRRRPERHPVLQQAQPAGDRRALLGGRQGHRQADHPLQHPVARRRRHARTTCSPSWPSSSTSTYVKQANNDNLAPVDGLGIYAGNDEILLRDAGHRRLRRHLRRQPPRRRRDAPHGRRARAPRRRSTRRCATSTPRWASPPTRSRSRPR